MKQCLLSICLITYNHEKYIREAIDSVLMQNVNFDWELIIADDCSKDNTRNILLEYKEKYPDFINLILQEKNVGPAQNWKDLITYPKSKYIAYFEGDDYWTDPLKLQKQVDFLEVNPNFSFTFHNCEILNEKTGNKFERNLNKTIDEEPDIVSVIIENNAPSASLLYRNFEFNLLPDWFFVVAKGDYALVAILAKQGKGKYFKEPMSVYRIHNGGVWSSQNYEYTFVNDMIFYNHLLNYFKEQKVLKIINKKINFVKANRAIVDIREGKIIKGLFQLLIYNNWFSKSLNIKFKKIGSALKTGINKY